MVPSFLITLREVIEATLIVATILGILVKIGQKDKIKTVWMATASAGVVCFVLLLVGSIFGLEIQKLYTGRFEEMTEGIFMTVSAVFVTYAVFFLHKYFSSYKVKLLQKVKSTIDTQERRGLFILVFTAVFREGFEIVLFLSTIYFSSNPASIMTGFSGGLFLGILLSFALFTATIRLPIFYAFRVTSLLLIMFAAGLFARGVHEFMEAGLVPELHNITLSFLPQADSFMGEMIRSLFGISQYMDIIQISLYSLYTGFMIWWVFFRKSEMASVSST